METLIELAIEIIMWARRSWVVMWLATATVTGQGRNHWDYEVHEYYAVFSACRTESIEQAEWYTRHLNISINTRWVEFARNVVSTRCRYDRFRNQNGGGIFQVLKAVRNETDERSQWKSFNLWFQTTTEFFKIGVWNQHKALFRNCNII